jgi:hypothetical protein
VKKRVSADTITHLTLKAAFAEAVLGTPPTKKEMIQQIRDALDAQIENARHPPSMMQKSNAANDNQLSLAQSIAQRQRFEEILKTVPEGFRLVPVLYSKITYDQNRDVKSQYQAKLRRDFLKFLAAEHEGELRAMGICDHGIQRMHQGLDPADVKDQLYHTSVDHIVERSGGGKFSLEMDIDPLRHTAEAVLSYKVNHFDNFILLPDQIHRFKNELNDLQSARYIPNGQHRWVLMLIPEVTEQHKGFVARPQPVTHPLHGVHKKPQEILDGIGYVVFMLRQAQEALQQFKKNELVGPLLKTLDSIALRQKKPVAVIAREEQTAIPPQQGLTAIFNKAVSYDPLLKKELEDECKPPLADAVKYLQISFETATKPDAKPHEYAEFVKFFTGGNVYAFKRAVAGYPLEESIKAYDLLEKIEREIESREALEAKNEHRGQKGKTTPKSHGQQKHR